MSEATPTTLTTSKINITLTKVDGEGAWSRGSWRAMCVVPRHDQGVGDDRRRALGDLFLSMAPQLTLGELTIVIDHPIGDGEVVAWTPQVLPLRIRSNDRKRAIGGLLLALSKSGRYVDIHQSN